MKVWIVGRGSMDGWSIDAIFEESDKDRAIAFALTLKGGEDWIDEAMQQWVVIPWKKEYESDEEIRWLSANRFLSVQSYHVVPRGDQS